MLKKDLINGLILLFFAALMREFLTSVTLLFVIIGVLLTWFHLRPGTILRNGLALTVFVSYWFTYGKVIDPEIGLNFLTSIIVLKLLERETERDDYMIFYGLILIVATGSLFVKNLAYLSFFIISFFSLIALFYYQLGLTLRWSQFFKNILWVAPITLFFFFLTPRLLSPIPLNPAPSRSGEVGYRPDVNISEIDTLNLSSETVFEVKVDRKIYQKDLYWRGNTLSFTDGWNWPLMSQDRSPLSQLYLGPIREVITQQIRLHGQYQFFFGLDKPLWIKTSTGVYKLNENFSAEQSSGSRFQKYEVMSSLNNPSLSGEENLQFYLRKGLKKGERLWIERNFRSQNFYDLTKEVEEYFKRNNFSYTLSPGRIQNFDQFIDKRVGFCSHYASALALILRTKGIPSRLVSGFHGGVFNPYSQTYTIAQNDAHVWVESLHDGQWIRTDPTLWIVPERIELGGEAFLQKVSGRNRNWSKLPFASELRDMSMWINQWDFKFYNWLEGLDYHQQIKVLKRFNIQREHLFSLIPSVILLFLLVIILRQKYRQGQKGDLEKLWILYKKKISNYGIELNLNSIRQIQDQLETSTDPNKLKMIEILNDLIKITFEENQTANIKEISKRIRSL